MKEILLSIIIPVYNVEKYILKCLDSIIPQLTAETELILVDDCTPDRAGKLAQARLNEIDANVTYFRRLENGGLSAARNSGLELAKGKFCWFVDSDDFVSMDAVETIVKHITEQDADLLIFNHKRITENGEITWQSNMRQKHVVAQTPEERLTQMCAFLKNMDMGFCVWRRVYSMEIIRKNNLQFEPNKDVFAEDICFNLYYLNYCTHIHAVEPSLYYYLLRGNSIMGSNQERPRLTQMHTLAKKVYNHTPFRLVREQFDLLYAAIMGIHYAMACWQDIEQYSKDLQGDTFALEMSRETKKNVRKHFLHYGKRNSAYQYVCAEIMDGLMSGRKRVAKAWFSLMRLMRKWNV